MEEKSLIVPINLTPEKLFAPEGLEPFLKAVEQKVKEFKGSVETSQDRKDIASFAYKIAQTKTQIEKWGKDLVSGEKAKLKLIDAERKRSKDFLTNQAAIARKPLTDYEDAEKKRLQDERDFEIYLLEWDEAIEINIFEDKKAEILKKEAEFAKKEKDLKEKEEIGRLQKEQAEREERFKAEATERANREAEEKLKALMDQADKAEKEKIEIAEKAKKDKQDAIEKAKRDAEAEQAGKERELERIKAEEDRKAANKNHQRRINKEAVEDLMILFPFKKDEAEKIITAIIQGGIRHLTINY